MIPDGSYAVYVGKSTSGEIVYVGITRQIPSRRFSWHKSNGKDLSFSVVSRHGTHEIAAAEEIRLIEAHCPNLNKRGVFLPKSHLTENDLKQRRENGRNWCPYCLRRRLSPGYTICRRCELVGATEKA